jgi:hypothetical protein
MGDQIYPDRQQLAAYIHELATELAGLARGARLTALACLLETTSKEAEAQCKLADAAEVQVAIPCYPPSH